jgi:crotonobetainyl-CoA:carnitine CoA-transferase CaiB-like acyl-CoA transferase
VTTTPAARTALGSLRVLDLADEQGHFCGMLLAQLGADVIKVEPPGGAAARRSTPFRDDIPDVNGSLYQWHFDAGKRGVTLDVAAKEGQALLRRLVETADVLVESHPPGFLEDLGLGYATLAGWNPKLIVASITPFGQTGPYRDFAGSDLVGSALGGIAFMCGYDDLPGSPPINPDGEPTYHIGSMYGVLAVLAAVWGRHFTGLGRHIDLSAHESVNASTEWALPTYFYEGKNVRRQTGRHASQEPTQPWQFRCRDGRDVNLLGVLPRSGASWKRLLAWMEERGAAGDLTDPKYSDFVSGRLQGGSWRDVDKTPEGRHIVEVIVAFVQGLTSDEVYHGGQKLALPWSVIRAPDELPEDGHLADRGFFAPVEYSEGEAFVQPGAPYTMSETPAGTVQRAPLLGEHNLQVYGEELGLTEQELSDLSGKGII